MIYFVYTCMYAIVIHNGCTSASLEGRVRKRDLRELSMRLTTHLTLWHGPVAD